MLARGLKYKQCFIFASKLADNIVVISQILVLDNRSFGKSTLLDPVLARYQGPALLAFNDSSFTEQDWKNLQSISRSEKRNDISKAGKVCEISQHRLVS